MIPESSFLLDGDTALWVWRANEAFDGETGEDYIHTLDRPCDLCGGDCEDGPNFHTPIAWHCPNCIDGRHTFEIEVGGSGTHWDGFVCGDNPCWEHDRALLVSVVPGMVLPITDKGEFMSEGSRFIEAYDDYSAIAWVNGAEFGTPITLPPDAKPGMWAVQLQLVESEG